MNKHNVLKLARRIEKMPHHNGRPPYFEEPTPIQKFNMKVTHCGSVACIGGVCREMFNLHAHWAEDSVAWALDIPLEDACRLCFPPNVTNYIDITPLQASKTLRKLAATGKVDWSHLP